MTADRVLLWRHGRTPQNESGVWEGLLDTELDEVGRTQAAQAADALAAALAGLDPVVLVSSQLKRARTTAQALSDVTGLPVTVDERLREVDVGRWQGLTRTQIHEAGMGDELAAWLRDEDIRAGGGELRSAVGRRGAAAIREHAAAQDGGVLVVASHGALIRGAVLSLLDLDSGGWRLLAALGNGNWVEIEPREPEWRLVAYNRSAQPGLIPIYPRPVASAAGGRPDVLTRGH